MVESKVIRFLKLLWIFLNEIIKFYKFFNLVGIEYKLINKCFRVFVFYKYRNFVIILRIIYYLFSFMF